MAELKPVRQGLVPESPHKRGRRGPSLWGEDAAQSLSRFEVDRHPSKMTARKMNQLREFYQIPDYVEFRLPRPSHQPTRPPPGYVAVYRDYFLKRLQFPLHSFLREALLNLDVSFLQLNLNAV